MNVRYSIMAREALVHKRVIGVEESHDTTVFADDAVEEHLRFSAERLPQVIVEVLGRRLDLCKFPQVEPLPGKVRDQRLRLRIREHPARLLLEDFRIAELPFHGNIE